MCLLRGCDVGFIKERVPLSVFPTMLCDVGFIKQRVPLGALYLLLVKAEPPFASGCDLDHCKLCCKSNRHDHRGKYSYCSHDEPLAEPTSRRSAALKAGCGNQASSHEPVRNENVRELADFIVFYTQSARVLRKPEENNALFSSRSPLGTACK